MVFILIRWRCYVLFFDSKVGSGGVVNSMERTQICIITYNSNNTKSGVIPDSLKMWISHISNLERILGVSVKLSTNCKLAGRYAEDRDLPVFVSNNPIFSPLILADEALMNLDSSSMMQVVIIDASKDLMTIQDIKDYLNDLRDLNKGLREVALISSKRPEDFSGAFTNRNFKLLLNSSFDVTRITKSYVYPEDISHFSLLTIASSMLGFGIGVLRRLSRSSLLDFAGVDSFAVVRAHSLGLKIKSYVEKSPDCTGRRVSNDGSPVSETPRKIAA